MFSAPTEWQIIDIRRCQRVEELDSSFGFPQLRTMFRMKYSPKLKTVISANTFGYIIKI